MMAFKSGASRFVVLLGNYAFKFPHPGTWRRFLNGLLNNMTEADFSVLGWKELCPVLFSLPGGFMVVMKRASDPPPLWGEDDFRLWLDKAKKNGRTIPAESKCSSFGTIDGEIVAVDYGGR